MNNLLAPSKSPGVCSPVYCNQKTNNLQTSSPSPPTSDQSEKCALGNASAAEVGGSIGKGLLNMFQLGFTVSSPDPMPKDSNPIQSARDHLNEVNALGSLIAAQEAATDISDLITLINNNQTLDMQLMNLNAEVESMGIKQNKYSIMVSNILIMMLIIFILFTN